MTSRQQTTPGEARAGADGCGSGGWPAPIPPQAVDQVMRERLSTLIGELEARLQRLELQMAESWTRWRETQAHYAALGNELRIRRHLARMGTPLDAERNLEETRHRVRMARIVVRHHYDEAVRSTKALDQARELLDDLRERYDRW